jgi:adhesin transport system membrane fusion protein
MMNLPIPHGPALPESPERIGDGDDGSATGALIFSLSALLLAALLWLGWAQVGEVVRAPGRVEPAGRVKIINDPQGGRIAEVHVREGQRVEAGAPLVTFDAQVSEREQAELLGRWQSAVATVARLEAEAAGRPLITFDEDLANARPDLVDAESQLIEARSAALASRRETLERSIDARRGELRSAQADAARIDRSLGLLREQLAAVEELAARGLYPRLKLVGVQREVGDTEGELRKAQAGVAAANAAMAEASTRLDGLEREWRSDVLTDLTRLRGERDRLLEALRAQQTRLANVVVRSPVPGVVDALAVTGPGQAMGPTTR